MLHLLNMVGSASEVGQFTPVAESLDNDGVTEWPD